MMDFNRTLSIHLIDDVKIISFLKMQKINTNHFPPPSLIVACLSISERESWDLFKK